MRSLVVVLVGVAGCASVPVPPSSMPTRGVDVGAIVSVARDLAADSMRGRGPWTAENERAARYLAAQLQRLGAKPVFGDQLLVPFVSERRPGVTVYNVAGILPSRSASAEGELVGITAHLDHLGVGKPSVGGDSIYNGFLDDAIGIGMALDVARRYRDAPGDRPLAVLFFNLEEQGLLGAQAMVGRPDAQQLTSRLKLLVGIDAGSPAGEALEWQMMGALPDHQGARVADSLARVRGWTINPTPPRGISDVYPFSQKGVPILFPIPGARWKGYTTTSRAAAMARFDHYHDPADEYDPAFPLAGTEAFADWIWSIVRVASRRD